MSRPGQLLFVLPTQLVAKEVRDQQETICRTSTTGRSLHARRTRRSALAFPAWLPEASCDGGIGNPVLEDPDREDARSGGLGEHQVVRRIWSRRRHLHPAYPRPPVARRHPPARKRDV